MKKKTVITGLLVAASLLFVYACTSQEECEDMIGTQYKFRIDLYDEFGNYVDSHYVDTYAKLDPKSTTVTFSRKVCDRRRVRAEQFEWADGQFNVTPL